MKAETARCAAQTSNDFAPMDKLFGNDLTYNHFSAVSDDKVLRGGCPYTVTPSPENLGRI